MKLFTRCFVLLLAVAFLPAYANAQQIVGVARGKADKPRVYTGSSGKDTKSGSQIVGAAAMPTDHLGNKKKFDLTIHTDQQKQDLEASLYQAIQAQKAPPSYFGDGYVRDICQKVKGCMQWAKAEFAKDNSFYISVFQAEHDCTAMVNGRKVVKHQYARFMYASNGRNQQIKTFAQVNVPVNSKVCFNCAHVSADCQPALTFQGKGPEYE